MVRYWILEDTGLHCCRTSRRMGWMAVIPGAYVYGDKELYEVTSHMSWATWFFLVMVVAATLYFFFKKR